MEKKICSLYIRDIYYCPSSYYRILQYTNNIQNIKFCIRSQLPSDFYNKIRPISTKKPYIKIFLCIVINARVNFQLFTDLIMQTKIIIISRRLYIRYMPILGYLLVKILYWRGCCFIWDVDDNVLEAKELDRPAFVFLSKYSKKILVTNSYVKGLFNNKYNDKLIVLPTTDGSFYNKIKSRDIKKRENEYATKVNLLWVGTSSNLQSLKMILDKIDEAAHILKKKFNKKLELIIICDKPIETKYIYLKIINILWTREVVLENMRTAHIGIMPLIENNFTKYKGAFKVIQYLSVGLPVIVSNVGINASIVENTCGLVVNDFDWTTSIIHLCSDLALWKKLSKKASSKWISEFSFNMNLKIWEKMLKDIIYA